MKKKLSLILIFIMVLVFALTLFACVDKDDDIIDDPTNPTKEKITVPQAMQSTYDGIMAGSDALSNAKNYAVESTYTLFTENELNYTITYKANYAENKQDSEIYLSFFDNDPKEHRNRLSVYYDKKNLYLLTDYDKKFIENFSMTSMFDAFFQLVRYADLSNKMFSETGAYIFNRDNSSLNLGIVLDADNVDRNVVTETRDSLMYTDIPLDIISDTINAYMENYLGDIGDKFDVITEKYLGFRLSRVISSRFSYINVSKMNFQRENGVADYAKINMSGSFRDASKYKIDGEVGYKISAKVDIKEKTKFDQTKFDHINLGQNNYVGKIFIPALSQEDFDISIVTNIDTKENSRNELSIDIVDAKKTHLMGAYYRDEIMYADISGLEEQYIKDAVDLEAFNLPKVFFEGINLTSIINAFYNSGIKMLTTILDRSFVIGDIENENLYSIIMENFGSEGNTIYYTITEELIQLIREDDTRTAVIIADMLGVPVEKLDSILGEEFFSLSSVKISYNLDTGTIGVSYFYDKELVFRMTVDEEDYEGVIFPADTILAVNAYNRLIIPNDIKTEIIAELEVSNGKVSSDMSQILGAFMGDPSGKNTPFKIKTGETLVLKAQASESFVSLGSSDLISQYLMRFDIFNKKDMQNALMSVYTNPQNINEYLVSYALGIGKDLYKNENGVKFRIQKSEVGASLNEILGENNVFEDSSLFGIISEILKGKSSRTQLSNSDGYFNFVLQAETDPKTGEKFDPVKRIIGVSDLIARVKTRFLFSEVVLNDIRPADFSNPVLDSGSFESAVGIQSLYSPNSYWKDTIEVRIGNVTINMAPNYIEESVTITGDKKQYTPTSRLFGKETRYILTIYSEIGTYTIKRLLTDTIIIDPAFTNKLPTTIEVEFTNGKVGVLDCKIEGLTDNLVTLAGLHLEVFANEKKQTYTLKIGNNSIMETAFTVYVAVQNRTVINLTEGEGEDLEELTDDANVPVVGIINIDPYEYAMRKSGIPYYNPILEGIIDQNMRLNFANVYGKHEVSGEDLTFDAEGFNYFFISKLNLDWQFDESKIKYNGAQLFAYAYYGAGATKIKIAIKVNVMAKAVNYVKINDEDNNKYTIDSLIPSTYNIPTQSGVNTSIRVYFNDNTYRIVQLNRPENISDKEYYETYLPTELAWYIPNSNYMNNVSLEMGASALFGMSMGNKTYATINIGNLGLDRVELYVEVPERWISTADLKGETAVKQIIENGDGTFTLDKATPVQISPVMFNKGGELYEFFSINPYDENGKLPNEIYMRVYKQYTDKNERVMKKYNVSWLTTAGIGGAETNILFIDDDGYARLKNPTTDKNDFLVYGIVGIGDLHVVISTWVRNLASELKSIEYEGLPKDVAEITIDPYKTYKLPSMFTATLASNEKVYRTNISWMVKKDGDEVWVPINKPTTGNFDPTYYDKNGKYLFGYEGGTYWIRYILEASGSVLRQEMLICIRVESRTIVSDTINIYEAGSLTAGYDNINYYKAESKVLLDRINALINDTQKTLRVGVGFEEARTDLILDRYNLYVDWLRQTPTDADYKSSIDYLAYILQNPKGEEAISLKGTIFTGTVNEQSLNVTFSLAGLVISNITLNNAEYSESLDAVILPQKEADGRINMSSILEDNELIIEIPKVFALTVPVSNLERYANPYQYINYIFEKIIMVYYNGTTDSEITPVLDFGEYTQDSFNRKVLGRTDGIYSIDKESETIIYINKLSAGSAQENIKVVIKAKIDERKENGDQKTAELYNELGESCTQAGYLLPAYIDIPYEHSGLVRYYLSSSGWRTSDLAGAEYATNIELTSINVLSSAPSSYAFYHILPMQGFMDGNLDDGYYHLNINIPRKNINNVNYDATAVDSTYNITSGYISVNNAYLFYNDKATYTSGNTTYKTGFDYTRLPEIINAKIVPDYFEATSINYFIVSWIPNENAITQADIVNGIDREDKRVLATAKILSYYNELKEHVTQTITVYIEMDAMVFSGIEYSVNGTSLDIRKDEQLISNTIVIDPYDEKIGYNGIFKLPTIGLILNFERNQRFTVTPSTDSTQENPKTDDIRRFELLDKQMQYIRTITEIPYGYSGYILPDTNLPDNGLLYVKMVMFTGQEIILTINILSRVVDQAIIANTVVVNGENQVKELERLYYIDPYNSITHQLPTNASIFFLNSDEFATLSISRWEIFDENTANYIEINKSPYFYSLTSSTNPEYKYAYYNSSYQNGYTGGIFTLRAYISMGTSASGMNIGEQGFEVAVIILNRSLKNTFTTSYEYTDPISGLLKDIGCVLDESMFVNYDKFYAAEFESMGFDKTNYYSAIGDGPSLPKIDWSRYVDDSIITYEGFSNRNIDGFLYADNTNLNYMYNLYKQEVETTYAELIKSMTWDSYFNVENGKLVPLNYYSTDTNRKLREALSIIEIEVKNQTYRQLLNRFNSSESTAIYAQRMENTLLRSVMSNNESLTSDREGIAFLYDMLKSQHSANDIRPEDRLIFLAWVDLYNTFKGDYPGYVENIDAERLTPYQMLKRDMYDKAERELYFYGAENNYNNALYAAASKKLSNNIKSAIWQKMYNMATRIERERMDRILGDNSNVTSRANALSVLMVADLKSVGSYGEKAIAKISAPQVTFDKFKDNIDTFYFNIYTTLALDQEVYAEFLINKEAIFEDLIDIALEDVIDAYRKGIISTTLQEYFNALKAEIVNTMVPVDSNGEKVAFYYAENFHTYDYAVDKNNYNEPAKKAAAITTYRSFSRQQAIQHIGAYNNEATAKTIWDSLYGAYVIKSNTSMITVMSNILSKNYNAYVASMNEFKLYLQNEASKRFDLSIEYADKKISGIAVDSLISNPKNIGDINNNVQAYAVFAEVYAPSIGEFNRPGDIYNLVYNSLNSELQGTLLSKFNEYSQGSYSYMRTIYYFLNDPMAERTVKAATQDFFFVKLCEAAGKNFFDLLYQKSNAGDIETKESLQVYLDNVVLGYSNPTYDVELRKARVFRSLQTYYASMSGDGANYRTLIQDIYESVLIDIKATAYDNLFNTLFISYLEEKESFKQARGNVNATAFDYLLKSYEKDADTIIKLYNDKVDNYIEENIFRHAESIYNKMQENNYFEYRTSKEDATTKNYLNITESEEKAIEREAVEYYYNKLATEDQKLKIEASSGIFGEYLSGGKYQAPEGVYQYLIYRYDLGEEFISDLKALRYHCLLNYAQNNIENTVNDVYSQPTDPYYVEYYYNVQRDKLNAMGTGVYTEDAILQFAKKGYINYQIQQVVLKNYLSEKQTLNTRTLIPQGKEKLYYQLYVNDFKTILNNQGTSIDGVTAFYYNLFSKLPQGTGISDQELTNILQNHVVLRGKKESYYAIFATAKEIMEKLEVASYNAKLDQDKSRYFDTYNKIKTYLLENALEKVTNASYEVEIQAGYVKVFDDFILPYYTEDLNLPSYVIGKTRQELRTQLQEIRENVSYVDQIMVDEYNNFVTEANSTQKAFIDALARQEMLRRQSGQLDDHLKTIVYMDLVYIINTSLTYLAFNLDYDLVEISDIEKGTRTQFSDAAKQNYIDLVLELLNEENFTIALAVLEDLVKENRYQTDFYPLDTLDGLDEEEKAVYLAELAEYNVYLQKIYDKLLLTSLNETVKLYQSYIAQGRFLTAIKTAISDYLNVSLQGFTKHITDGSTSDATYLEVLEKMVNDSTIEYKFYTQDHISSEDPEKDRKNKHLLLFDVKLLQDEENSSTQDINKISLTNLSKYDKNNPNPQTVIKRDGFRFIYPQIEIVYVDYYNVTDVEDAQDKYNGVTTSENRFLNKITIDPLNPDLPSKVRAYGTYRKAGSGGAYGILDVGMINVTYDDIFRSLEGEYSGNAPEGDSSSSYQITAVNNKNDRFLISLTVFYLDRTVQSYYVNGAGYTSSANIISSGDYAKYYNLYDSTANKNKIIIDPTQEEMVDKDNKTYLMPTSFVANYTNYEADTYRNASPRTISYYNVVWDLSSIKYTLSGLKETSLRVLSYYTNVGDGTYNRLVFDYVNNNVRITKFSEADNSIISANTFVGIPSYSIWNVSLTVTTKTVDRIYKVDEYGERTLLAKFVSDDVSGIGNSERWLVAEDGFAINPYYVEFFQNIVLEFSDGDFYEINYDIDWNYHGQNGIDKLRDIVNKSITEPNNRYIVAGFNYISETIWVKLMIDNIEIERPTIVGEDGNMQLGYINGGTIYLLAQTQTYNIGKEAQLASFYPYMYYNFSKDKFNEDWRRVPLTFAANDIRSIVLAENRSYENIKASLGNNSGGTNISFTVKVINPSLYALNSGDNNQYVIYDSISMPIDGNSRVISQSSDMPQIIGNYFIQLNGAQDTLFHILTTSYDVVNEKVIYECKYYMDSSEAIAGQAGGVRTLSFKAVLPLKTYNYTGINDIRFVTTNSDNFRWRTVNSFEDTDSLYWKLGSKMKPSLLPQGYDAATGERINFMWDLDNINVNLASTGESYYTARAYYYAASAQWVYKEVNIYIEREDISSTIATKTNIDMVYNGNKYTYELDSSKLNKLRMDGSLAQISLDNVKIEYRISTSSDYNYSTSYRPLNAGTYFIRITVDDYNFFGEVVITLVISPYKIKGVATGIGGQGIIPDISFEGADTNNYIHYVYNGQTQGLVVAGGLPFVHVQNWPQTRDQKDRLYLSRLGQNPTSGEITIAKSAAYNQLFGQVTAATQVFLTKFKAQVKLDYNIISENELNAKAFDLLDYNLYICEVVPIIVYKNANDIILEREPVDVGTYLFSYNIQATQNNGNYILDERTLPMAGRIVIEKPDVTYSLVSETMVYNGANQNPLINNLHLPNGNLPIGVTVTYTYRYIKNLEWITTNEVSNVQSYGLTIQINGGNNYPSATLSNLTVSIVPQDLFISFDENKTQSEYLSKIVDYGKNLKFVGLIGSDKGTDFFSPAVSGNVKEYYTLGKYPIQINGFKLDEYGLDTYTKYDGEPIEINGVSYYKLTLKNANEAGSLYAYLNENNNYQYEELINKFLNYNVYVKVDNFYTIYPDGEAILVANDAELSYAIAQIPDGGRATIYLAAGAYSQLTININASITIIGCYDENAKIISTLENVIIREGEVTLRIIDIKGKSNSDSVYIGDKAGMVSILECYLDGLNLINSRAIVTSTGYSGLLYMNKTTITRFTRALELQNGTAEITQSVFHANSFGISSYTKKDVYIRDCDFTSTSNIALYLAHENFIVLECYFAGNLTAVRANESGRNSILLQNTFTTTNGNNFVPLS